MLSRNSRDAANKLLQQYRLRFRRLPVAVVVLELLAVPASVFQPAYASYRKEVDIRVETVTRTVSPGFLSVSVEQHRSPEDSPRGE